MRRNTKLTKEEEDLILECYIPSKTSLRDVEKLCNISRNAIKKVLIKHEIEILPKQKVYPSKSKGWKVCGIGVNDATYKFEVREYEVINGKQLSKLVWMCPYYSCWCSMIRRCYGNLGLKTYKDCTVCKDWLTFSNFKSWMEKQDWVNKELDKDILFIGNKVYSPETCIFVTHKVNTFILEPTYKQSGLPTGVTLIKSSGKYEACCKDPETNKKVYLGCFSDPDRAHAAWKSQKLTFVKNFIKNGEISDEQVANALISRYS